MNTQIPDKKIHNLFDQIKAPDSSIIRLQESIAKENSQNRRFYYRSQYIAIAACCLLLVLCAVSTVPAGKAAIHKYSNQLLEYFYGKNQKETPNDSSVKKNVENNTDSQIRTKQIEELKLTVYNTISYISEESHTRLGCMYFSVEFTDPNSKSIFALWDKSTDKQRFFDKNSEIDKKAVTQKNYNSWIDIEVSDGDFDVLQAFYYYDEQKSSNGKYYFAVRWYIKDYDEPNEFHTIDWISLSLFDYSIEFNEENDLTYGGLPDSQKRFHGNGLSLDYHTKSEEKSFKLSNGYTLYANPIGTWLIKEKKQNRKEAYRDDYEEIEKKWIHQVEKKRSNTKIKYNGQTYSLTELAPTAFEGTCLTNIEPGHGCWISAASFFENPIDINQIEEVY